MKRIVIALALALALVAAGCSSDSEKAESGKAETHDHHEGMDHGMDDGTGDTASLADKGLGMLHNGHHEEMKYVKLDGPTQAELDRFVEISKEVAEQYPTLGEFHAAGARNAGPFSPGLGLHVTAPWIGQGLNPDGVIDEADAKNPMIVIYDGTDDDAKVAGFMYYSVAEDKPEGFPGPNDTWHYHTDTCLKMTENGTEAPFGADRSTTKEQCDSVGGMLMDKTQWMVHVWSVPGYEVAEKDGGIFAELNPKLDCPDGTYYQMDEKYWKDHPTNFCKSELN